MKTCSVKKTREHFKKMAIAENRLRSAMCRAHNDGVIVYTDFKVDSPCGALDEVWARILRTTEKQLAAAFRSECY